MECVCDDEMDINVDGFPFEHEYNLRTAWAVPRPVMSQDDREVS